MAADTGEGGGSSSPSMPSGKNKWLIYTLVGLLAFLLLLGIIFGIGSWMGRGNPLVPEESIAKGVHLIHPDDSELKMPTAFRTH